MRTIHSRPLRGYRTPPGTNGEEENILEIEARKLSSALALPSVDSRTEISVNLPVQLALPGIVRGASICVHLLNMLSPMQLLPEIASLAGVPHAFSLSTTFELELLKVPTKKALCPCLSKVASIQGEFFGLLGPSVRVCDLAVLSRREAGRHTLKL